MGRIVYVNGRYAPYHEANIHVEDRGFQFADAVYEVMEVRTGRLVDATRHINRLWHSLNELSIPAPMSEPALRHVIAQTISRNRVHTGAVYLQVTRGAAPRDFAFPDPDLTPPSLVVIARARRAGANDAIAVNGIAVMTLPDIRWGRCDIKTVMLLPACLAKEQARAGGATEAWLVDANGYITEGASSNAWIIDSDGQLVTRSLGPELLPGVTRATAMDVVRNEDLKIIERPFTPQEAYQAREAFVTSASNVVMPVVKIDDRPIGDGTPGPIAPRLRSLFYQFAEI
jgi:D-alanine transaminase